MKKPSPEQLELMQEQRRAGLIRRWLKAGKLSESEKAEISDLIPLDILNAGPTAPGAQEAASGALNTRKHAKFKKKLPEYCDTYETGDRGLKYWIRRGKLLNDLPPLDEPEKMADWWRRCMPQQVPDKLLAYEKPAARDPIGVPGDERSSQGSPAAGESDGANRQSGSDRSPRDFSKVQSLDIAENVEALRHTHAVNKHLLDEALAADPPNDNASQLRQKNFERSFELLRKAESTLIELQRQRGDLIDAESVRTELAQFLESLRLMRETMPRRVTIELERILPPRFRRVAGMLTKYLLPAVEKARADEENMFRNLETLTGPEAVRDQLLAA